MSQRRIKHKLAEAIKLPAPPPPQQIPLSKGMARAIANNMNSINSLALKLKAAQAEFNAALASHQQVVTALINDAGKKPEEFGAASVWEDPDTKEMYLRQITQAELAAAQQQLASR